MSFGRLCLEPRRSSKCGWIGVETGFYLRGRLADRPHIVPDLRQQPRQHRVADLAGPAVAQGVDLLLKKFLMPPGGLTESLLDGQTAQVAGLQGFGLVDAGDGLLLSQLDAASG